MAKLPPIKITFLGDSSVGKSSLVTRIVRNEFTENTFSTIGAAFCTKKYTPPYPGARERLFHLWDTAGQERYFSLIPLYLSGAAVIVVVYDITDIHSFEDVSRKWLPYIRQNMRLKDEESMPMIFLIGNKSDLERHRQVSKHDAEAFAKEHNIGFIESSAKTGHGAKEILTTLTEYADRLILRQADEIRRQESTVNLEAATQTTNEGGWSCFGVSRLWK